MPIEYRSWHMCESCGGMYFVDSFHGLYTGLCRFCYFAKSIRTLDRIKEIDTNGLERYRNVHRD